MRGPNLLSSIPNQAEYTDFGLQHSTFFQSVYISLPLVMWTNRLSDNILIQIAIFFTVRRNNIKHGHSPVSGLLNTFPFHTLRTANISRFHHNVISACKRETCSRPVLSLLCNFCGSNCSQLIIRGFPFKGNNSWTQLPCYVFGARKPWYPSSSGLSHCCYERHSHERLAASFLAFRSLSHLDFVRRSSMCSQSSKFLNCAMAQQTNMKFWHEIMGYSGNDDSVF